MDTEKYIPEAFPALFFLNGLMMSLLYTVKDSIIISFLMLGVGMAIYILLIFWFNYELKGSQK